MKDRSEHSSRRQSYSPLGNKLPEDVLNHTSLDKDIMTAVYEWKEDTKEFKVIGDVVVPSFSITFFSFFLTLISSYYLSFSVSTSPIYFSFILFFSLFISLKYHPNRKGLKGRVIEGMRQKNTQIHRHKTLVSLVF